ncbi:MAG: hypothetical protein NWE89_12875 [Candidatus Bathyarchaeota archaeon]|nr:hypothetical protein [Candidatus Bathyarchaeota archaeon]
MGAVVNTIELVLLCVSGYLFISVVSIWALRRGVETVEPPTVYLPETLNMTPIEPESVSS